MKYFFIQYHPFHLVKNSLWPLLTSVSMLLFTLNSIYMFTFNIKLLMMMSLMLIILSSIQWWWDIIRESTFQGFHSTKVEEGLHMSMLLFIIFKVFFYLFFWAFFHMMLSPSIELGNNWPHKGIIMFNPFNIPLLNTIILLTSGLYITRSHFSILNKNFYQSKISLMITIILGIMFTYFQKLESDEAMFTINYNVFGSTFFISTGFHGIHVIIGTIFIMISLIRLLMNHFSNIHHFGFEASAWYWNFVDVVWLFYMHLYTDYHLNLK